MKLLITGASGFLGRRVVAKLAATRGHDQLSTPDHASCDLTKPLQVASAFREFKPDAVIHLACPYGGGGIGYAQAHPFSLAANTMRMDTLVIQAAVEYGAKIVIGAGSLCEYPEESNSFVDEEHLWLGYPEPVNAPYGLAKRMQLVLLQAARSEHNLNGIHLILGNLYGPQDKPVTDSLAGHVIPATIVKCLKAVEKSLEEIICWGDGTPTRSFTHVDDAADAIVRALEIYDAPEPLNICDEQEISIRQLVGDIATLTGFRGRITWDTTKPNGQARRLVSSKRARKVLGWVPRVSYADGLRETVQWYKETVQ